MRHNFSAQFLRVLPPDTSYGQAWESLCYELLRLELGGQGLIRFRPPDRGIDILHRPSCCAYQCKSDERGALGSMSGDDSAEALRTAVEHQSAFGWNRYCFATNANYTGAAFEKITETARALRIDMAQVGFHGPEHWDGLCTKHFPGIQHRFDYRISATQKQVVEAFRSAGYYDQNVS